VKDTVLLAVRALLIIGIADKMKRLLLHFLAELHTLHSTSNY
jgi:hypothetical protein